jgi:hypothetical protein
MYKKLFLLFFASNIFFSSIHANNKFNKAESFTSGFFIGSITKNCVLYEEGVLNKIEAMKSIEKTINLLNQEDSSIRDFVINYFLEQKISNNCTALIIKIIY